MFSLNLHAPAALAAGATYGSWGGGRVLFERATPLWAGVVAVIALAAIRTFDLVVLRPARHRREKVAASTVSDKKEVR